MFGQLQNDILEYLNAVQKGNVVEINFAIRGGASCQGAELQRSQDGIHFTAIDFIPGVCGGSEYTEVYAFTDEQPFEYHTNHYRIELGGQGTSDIVAIHFVRLEEGYRIFPNPSSDWAVIRFDNTSVQPYTLQVYGPSGKLWERAADIQSSEIYMDLSSYSAGIYIFQLTSSAAPTITGRLIVQ
ncbi:MAG: T9SS type A sorting domain-containing protein [Flavobacteriales bacterium]|nr:T9SS type A sorting domain-containing protein [Flavobacteriales bacterium]